MTRLPPPEQWVLRRLDEMEVAEMIEKHIDYVDGDGNSVHLPMQFVRHFVQRHDDALPTVVAIATLPIVLADGGLLMPDGLDRLRGIIFKIPKELRAVIPAPEECDEEAVRKAMQFLTDDWLCDVSTNYAGKCTIIAAALTLIERSLLPDRPAFFVTAGKRGGGKTTTLTMLIMAVTGIRPAAAAWSPNEEERRKALLSYFLAGVSYILWDNITRGSTISCPHIEKSCTAAFYADRRLGVSEMVRTAAATIHFFTGNNIGPKGDLASRSLKVNIVVNRPDPENRKFRHADPIGWTEEHRAEILAALYTILLGNPMLDEPRDAACKTRFKMWWRLIGSAIEHGAELVNEMRPADKKKPKLDFQRLFLDQEKEEEESASLAEALSSMAREWPKGKLFTASDVADYINEGDGALREFLVPDARSEQQVSSRKVGKRLASHLDCPVTCTVGSGLAQEERILTLRVKSGNRGGILKYYVVEKSSA